MQYAADELSMRPFARRKFDAPSDAQDLAWPAWMIPDLFALTQCVTSVMPSALRSQPELHQFSASLRESFDAMLGTVRSGYETGIRHFSLVIPSPYWRRHAIVALIREFRHKTVILTAHPVAQQVWTESSSVHHAELSEVTAELWSDQTAHMTSSLPYSCAPVLILTDDDTEPRSAARSIDQEADRFVRHLVKHGYKLVILDHTCCTGPERSLVLGLLSIRSDAIVIHASTVLENDESLHANHCVFTPKLICRMDEAPFVREGYLSPYRHLLHCAVPTDREHAFLTVLQDRYDALMSLLWQPAEDAPSIDQWIRDAMPDIVYAGSTHPPSMLSLQGESAFGQALLRTALFHELIPTERLILNPATEARPTLDDLAMVLRRYRDQALHIRTHPALQRRTAAIDDFLQSLASANTDLTVSKPLPGPGTPKLDSARAILTREYTVLEDQLRALIIVDDPEPRGTNGRFLREKRLDGHAVLHSLVNDPMADSMHPVFLTGSSLICHDDLVIPILSETQKIVNLNGWDIQVTHRSHGEFSELIIEEGEWDPALYVRIVAQLCQRGITHCLVASHMLIASGWEALPLNTVIDCTTTSIAWVPVQHFPPQITPAEFPWRSVNYWDIVIIQPELLTGYADWDRVATKHIWLLGPTPDGWIERGIGHFDPAFTHHSGSGWASPAAEWNEVFLRRAEDRRDTQHAWKVGQTFAGKRAAALDCWFPSAAFVPACPALPQRRQLERELAAFHERTHSQQLRVTMSGIVVVGVVVSVMLLADLTYAAIVSGLMLCAYLGVIFGWTRKTRTMRARAVPFSAEAWVGLLADILLSAMRSCPREFSVSSDATVESHPRAQGRQRLVFDGLDERASLEAAAMMAELFQPIAGQDYYVQIMEVDLRNNLLHVLARMPSLDTLERPLLLLPIPGLLARSTEGVKSFLQAVQKRCGPAVLVSRAEIATNPASAAQFPPTPASIGSIWH
jgi:hypothetical protein